MRHVLRIIVDQKRTVWRHLQALNVVGRRQNPAIQLNFASFLETFIEAVTLRVRVLFKLAVVVFLL